jgi:homoserine acetyltransferase
VSARFDHDLERAAKEVRARLLVIYSPDDHTVTPDPVKEFARAAGATAIAIPSACGHGVSGCERPRVAEIVRKFLAQSRH